MHLRDKTRGSHLQSPRKRRALLIIYMGSIEVISRWNLARIRGGTKRGGSRYNRLPRALRGAGHGLAQDERYTATKGSRLVLPLPSMPSSFEFFLFLRVPTVSGEFSSSIIIADRVWKYTGRTVTSRDREVVQANPEGYVRR